MIKNLFLKPSCYAAFFAAVLFMADVAPVLAQQNGPGMIRAVRVEGTQRIEPATVLTYVPIQAGDSFAPDALDRALKTLYGTGFFSDIALYQEGNDLVIVVSENPIINEIRFEGNEKLKNENLLSEIQLRPRTVLTRSKVQADVDRLRELYRLSGRFSATIDPKVIKLDQNRVNLVFEVSEGPQTLISRILFVGNKKFTDDQLQGVVRSREERWWRIWSGADKYDPDRLAFDREMLRKFYLENGYVDFQVESATAELSPDRRNFYVTFALSEGPRYKVGKIDVVSNIAGLDAAPYRQYVNLKSGEWYKASQLEKAIADLTTALGNNQYAFVDITPAVDRRREEQLLDITLSINEGRKVFVENINIAGNMRTLDEVVRREMTVAEGDPFNAARLRKSEQNVRDLGFFEDVQVKTSPGTTADKTNVDVVVSERSTGELSVGAGYSTSDGALGDFRIRERNFLGKGQDLLFATTLSARRTQFDISFTEPYFLDRKIAAGFDLFRVTRDYQDESSYDMKRSGGALRMGYKLSETLTHGLTYRYDDTEIENVAANASAFIRRQAGSHSTSAIGHRLTYDTTNSRLDPSEGLIARLENEFAGLGADARYFKSRIGATYYYPIRDKWVLSVLGDAGYVFGIGKDLRINERFYLGGATLRGFEDAGVGPRDTATGDSLGGNRFARGSVELEFPSGLPEDLGVRLRAFTDFGVLSETDDKGAGVYDENDFRMSAGMGVSWRSPMGPIRIDMAVPVIKKDLDETEFFRFSMGTRF